MLDIKFIRENKDLITEASRKKKIKFNVEKLLEVDDSRKKILQSVEEKRTTQNEFSLKIPQEKDSTLKLGFIEEMRKVKEEIQKEEEELDIVMKDWQSLMLQVPNIPDISVPDGESEADNKEIKKWGELPKFAFTPKNHIEIMESLDMVDLERGVKVAGFRGYFLKNDGALLSFAIWNYAMDFFLKRGFSPFIVPSLVRRENLMGTGFVPQGEEDLYKTQDADYLAGTAEVATMGYHADEVLPLKDLPKKFLSFSPCFRREAGSHGKDVKGLIRVHEFFKVEQVILCEANHETSVHFHEELNRNTEEFIESLGIPYHTVINCGADLGLGQVKKYDIELWVPLENAYREISSASYFHDFQTRRLNIRYKDTEGKMRFAHSLNSTAIPTPRILVSMVENYQEADGSVRIPEVLQKYMGGKQKLSKS
jgi:seryl-tRNA synthetase